MDQLLLNAKEVADVLGIGRSKSYELMASGEIPVVRIGSAVRATAAGLRKYVAEKTIDNSEPADPGD